VADRETWLKSNSIISRPVISNDENHGGASNQRSTGIVTCNLSFKHRQILLVTDSLITDYFFVPRPKSELGRNGFLDHQVIHDELPPGGSVLAHVELEQRLDHVTVIYADLG
jgi:hypothetical protein